MEYEDEQDLNIINIQRGQEFLYSFNQLLKKDLRDNLMIKFSNQLGVQEIGVDQGGIFQEFMYLVINQAYGPDLKLFKETEFREMIPSSLKINNQHLTFYEFIGKITARAIYDHILIQPMLSNIFINALLSNKNTFSALKHLDTSIYNSLVAILNMDQLQIQSLELCFTIDLIMDQGQQTIPLIENGQNIQLSIENRLEYVQLYSDFLLNRNIQKQSNAFKIGFRSVIPIELLHMFSEDELKTIISGENDYDVEELIESIKLEGFSVNSATVQYLYKVIREFDIQQKADFLMFVTSCQRKPTLGFSDLSPLFTVKKMDFGAENQFITILKLPTSSTCQNILYLPDYQSYAVTKSKLLQAIKHNTGFELG